MSRYYDVYEEPLYRTQPSTSSTSRRPSPAWLQDALSQDLRHDYDVPRSWQPPVLPPRSPASPSPDSQYHPTGRRRGYTVPMRNDEDRCHRPADLRSARSMANIRATTSTRQREEGLRTPQATQEMWDAQTASTASSVGRDKRFSLYQPVSVTLEKTSKNPFSNTRVTKQYRAIVVDCTDEFTYSVRLIPKAFPHLAAQFYRWNWYYGDRSAAIQEGQKVHAEGKWKLVELVHISQMTRASRKVALEGAQ